MMSDKPISLWAALRLLGVFHLKLLADTLRDIVFSPLSVLAVVLDLVLRHRRGATLFEQLMAFGHKSDAFINLFDGADAHPHNLDGVIERAESGLRKPRSPEQP
jgi:hypothetical protein